MNLQTLPRLNQLLAILRQPQWIAAVLSLGFHGVLFAAGPSFSSLGMAALEGNNPDLEERRVPLIELTPAEQGRLPDFSAPAYSLYPDSNADLFSLFPPSGNSLPLDSGSGFSSVPSIPMPKLPSSTLPGAIAPYRFPSRSSIVRRSSLPPVPRGSSLERRLDPSAENAASSASTPTTDASGNPPRPNAAGSAPSANAPQTGTGSAPADVATAPSATSSATERASELLARVEYSETQTSTAEVEFAKAAWLQAVKEELGDTVVQAPEPITLEVPYTGRLCLSPEPTEGLLGLVGRPSETEAGLTPWTAVLKSTGYPFLNQAAEQALRGLEPESDTEGSPLEPNTLYQVVVKVNYDSETCISREALLQSRRAEPGESSSQPE